MLNELTCNVCLGVLHHAIAYSFQAMFSSTKRRQLEQSLVDSSPHRPILAAGAPTLNKESNEDADTT